jgi:undecaprenyl-diphosphatase
MIEAVSESILLIAAAVVAYVVLALLTVRLRGAPPTSLDALMQRPAMAGTTTPWRRAGVIGSIPGYPGFYFAVTALLIWFLHFRGARGVVSLMVASVGGWATHRVIKLFVVRRRPASRAGHSHEMEAFPSGHTTATTAIALTVGYVFAAQGFLSTPVAAIIAIGIPILVGCSRVFADEHWTTDVIAGWAGGIGMAAIAILIFLRAG